MNMTGALGLASLNEAVAFQVQTEQLSHFSMLGVRREGVKREFRRLLPDVVAV